MKKDVKNAKSKKDLISKEDVKKVSSENASDKKKSDGIEAARAKMKAAAAEEIKPEQLNFNNVAFQDGDKKDFVFIKIDEVQDANGDWYDAAVLEDENGSQVINADIVLMNTLRPLEGEAPFAIRVTCSGVIQPKSGNKPYKNLTILRF